MAGLGTRFSQVGYEHPKPLIPVHGHPMFKIVLANLYSPEVESIVVVAQRAWKLGQTITEISAALRVPIRLIEIDYVTGGPAESVQLASPFLEPKDPVVVANSDQYVRMDISNFYTSVNNEDIEGVLLAMEDSDPKWSYISVTDEGYVTELREKEVISPLATVGIYGFRSADLMYEAFNQMRLKKSTVNGEYYVGPAYNPIIKSGGRVAYLNLGPVAETMFGMGTPEDFEQFLNTTVSRDAASDANLLFGGQ